MSNFLLCSTESLNILKRFTRQYTIHTAAGFSVKFFKMTSQAPNKPCVGIDVIPELVVRMYGIQPKDLKPLPGYEDLNFYFQRDTDKNDQCKEDVEADEYVLKIINARQSASPEIMDVMETLCAHVRSRGLPNPVTVLNKDGKICSLETFQDKHNPNQRNDPYLVRLATYIPGVMFLNSPYVSGSFRNVGVLIGKLHTAIADGFNHEFYDRKETMPIWRLSETPKLREYLSIVTDQNDRACVETVIDEFEFYVEPQLSDFTPGIIHGDLNEQNLVMRELPDQEHLSVDARVHDVTGIIDWAHTAKTFYVFDVAISIAYLSIECQESEQLDVGGHILSGYSHYRTLSNVEINCLPSLVRCRLIQSLVLCAHAYSENPDNKYLLTTKKRGWPLLRKLVCADDCKLIENWKKIMSE